MKQAVVSLPLDFFQLLNEAAVIIPGGKITLNVVKRGGE